jgi:hypothetical protein
MASFPASTPAPAPAERGAIAGGEALAWAGSARRALAEWVLVQAVVLGTVTALLWPLVRWARHALAALSQALAAQGIS